jgi:lysophospholipase L1-like esterase
MPLGDSITYGTDEAQALNRAWVDCHGGYRPTLWADLRAHGITVQPVGSTNVGADPSYDWHCEAHPGATTRDTAADLHIWNPDWHADIVLLQLGSNDPYNKIPVNDSLRYLADLWRQLYARHPQVLLMVATITPQRSPSGLDHHDLLNNGIRRQVAAWRDVGYNIQLVDMDRECRFSVADLGPQEGLHPSPSGYRKMATVWERAIQSLVSQETPKAPVK